MMCSVATDFLAFQMNDCLEFLQKYQGVWLGGPGFSLCPKPPAGICPHDVIGRAAQLQANCWATWADRWRESRLGKSLCG